MLECCARARDSAQQLIHDSPSPPFAGEMPKAEGGARREAYLVSGGRTPTVTP